MTVPSFSGTGYLAGEAPDGLTTVVGVPVSALVQVLWRDPDTDEEHFVSSTTSDVDGTWRVTGINHAIQYLVRGIKPGWNDVTVVGVTPSRMDVMTATGALETNEEGTGVSGSVLIEGGIPPYSVSVIAPLPYGLAPAINYRTLTVAGVSEDFGFWESLLRVTSSNAVSIDVPVACVVGLNLSVRYALAADWEIHLDWGVGAPEGGTVYVYRSSSPMDIADLPAPLATLAAAATTYTDNDITPGATYYYRVELRNAEGRGAVSSEKMRVAAWTPADLDDPCVWLDAEDLGAAGSYVALWPNRAGADFEQPVSTSQPGVVAVGGAKAVSLDGSNDWLQGGDLGLFRNVGAASCFALYRRKSTVGGYQRLFSDVGYTNGNARFVLFCGHSSGAESSPWLQTNWQSSTSTENNLRSGQALTTQFMLCTAVRDYAGGKARIDINGATVASAAGLVSATTSDTNSQMVALGRGLSSSTPQYAAVEVCVLIAAREALNSTQARRLEGWAAAKYGMRDLLPVDHPYKTVAP